MVPPWIEIINDQYQQVRRIEKVEDWQYEEITSPTFWLVLTGVSSRDISQLLKINNTELVLCCNPEGLIAHSPQTKEMIRCIKKIQRAYSFGEKRLHLLVNSEDCSAEDARALTLVGEKLGCNVKIGQDFPW